jgi:acylphosphatase
MKVLFSGRVQGVDFRYTVCRLASRFEVTGFVRNLEDGDVELIAEGEEQELLDFFQAIRNSEVARHVIREQLLWAKAENEFEQFGISY